MAATERRDNLVLGISLMPVRMLALPCWAIVAISALAISTVAISTSTQLHAADGVAPFPVGPGNRALSATDLVILEQAHRAGDRNNWQEARRLTAQTSNEDAARVVEWRYLRDDDSDASFQEISIFLDQHGDWPSRARLIARAEEYMPASMTPNQIILWFGERAPETSDGALRLGQALIAADRNEDGTKLIRDAWINNNFAASGENAFLSEHSGLLRPEDHNARLVELLAGEDVNEARRQLDRVGALEKRLADARITLKTRPASASSIPAALAPAEQSDPWFIYDRARALRRNGSDMEAWDVMGSAPTPLPSTDRWWRERHIMARDALKLSAYDISYQLTANTGMESGGGFADAEFLAGWIALRHQDKPAIALEHFQRLAAGVSFPISRARAHYWSGRAHDALGQTEDALTSYGRAAQDSTTFYGQLAMTRLTSTPILSLGLEMPAPDRRLDNDDRIRAMNALVDLDRLPLVRLFAVHLANEDRSPGRMRYLADFMSGLDDRTLALRIAKVASYSGVMLLPYLDPLIDIPQAARRDGVEPALVLGLTRQESEFNAGAVSHAGARGLMQLMPGTARQTARQIGIGYNQNRLTNPDYNMQLGSAHLEELLERWSGSYILTIAAYNAGSGNVARWVETYGDPRLPSVDVIDWIELIPFGETRNYVQRVLENIQVYRDRLAGAPQPLEILADLERSNAPKGEIPLPIPAPRG